MTDELLNRVRAAYKGKDCLGMFHRLEKEFSASRIQAVTRRAAVLVPIFQASHSSPLSTTWGHDNDDIWHVWLTRRSQHLRQGGDICLPGGHQEECDDSLVSTAVREAGEEIGILPSQLEILGPLPSLISKRGDRNGNMYTSITPVLSVVTDKGFQPNINPEEVATAFHLPLQRFLRSDSHSTRPWTLSIGGEELSMNEHCFEDDVSIQNRGETVVNTWGFTARILISCACLLFDGRPEYDMAEMRDQRGPFEYYHDWLHFAEEIHKSKVDKMTNSKL